MSAKVFLDTNIVVYAFDPSAPAKQSRARELLGKSDWVVGWQVVQEFSQVALHRFKVPMKPADLDDYLDLVLWPRCVVFPSPEVFRAATMIRSKTKYRFYDSLIVAAALASEADVLYSEDLQDGRKFGALTIRNPFARKG